MCALLARTAPLVSSLPARLCRRRRATFTQEPNRQDRERKKGPPQSFDGSERGAAQARATPAAARHDEAV